jgi:hypothetical protein
MIAGGVGAAFTTPLDVVKTRVMLEVKVGYFRGPPSSLTCQLNCAHPRTVTDVDFASVFHLVPVDTVSSGAHCTDRGYVCVVQGGGATDDMDIAGRSGVPGSIRGRRGLDGWKGIDVALSMGIFYKRLALRSPQGDSSRRTG